MSLIKFKNVILIPSGIVLNKYLIPIKNSLFPNMSVKYFKHFWFYALYKYFTLKTKQLMLTNGLLIYNHWVTRSVGSFNNYS